jgi:hypothetical protein
MQLLGATIMSKRVNDNHTTVVEKVRRSDQPLHTVIEALRSVHGDPEHLADPQLCLDCGSPTVKAAVEYAYDYPLGGDAYLTIAKTLPGYRCGNCHLEYQDVTLSDRFLTAVGSALARLGDTTLRDTLAKRTAHPASIAPPTPLPPEVSEQAAHLQTASPERAEQELALLYGQLKPTP